MERILGLCLAALAAATLLALCAAPALANHVHCGDVITRDTTLDSDLIDCPGTALTIGADNVTLDLGGFSVRSGPPFNAASETGIADEGHRGVRIENGQVHYGQLGIRLSSARDTEMRDLDLSGNPALESLHSAGTRLESSHALGGIPAIEFVESDDGAIIDSTADGYEEGLIIRAGSDRNVVERSTFSSYRTGGITVEESRDNRIAENRFPSAWFGVTLLDATGNEVLSNTVGAENYGITLIRSARNRVEHNSVSCCVRYCRLCLIDSDSNSVRGNLLASGNPSNQAMSVSGFGNLIERNDVSGNYSGIAIASGAGNVLLRNRANRSVAAEYVYKPDGILVGAEATNTVLKRNTANGNVDDGLDIRDPSTRLVHNTASFNGDLGIEAVVGVVGIGNRAVGNGNPLQCLNVFCKTNGPKK